jgi:hypothetical protein
VWLYVIESASPKNLDLNKYYIYKTDVYSLIVLKNDMWLNSTITHYIKVSLEALEMNGIEFKAFVK